MSTALYGGTLCNGYPIYHSGAPDGRYPYPDMNFIYTYTAVANVPSPASSSQVSSMVEPLIMSPNVSKDYQRESRRTEDHRRKRGGKNKSCSDLVCGSEMKSSSCLTPTISAIKKSSGKIKTTKKEKNSGSVTHANRTAKKSSRKVKSSDSLLTTTDSANNPSGKLKTSDNLTDCLSLLQMVFSMLFEDSQDSKCKTQAKGSSTKYATKNGNGSCGTSETQCICRRRSTCDSETETTEYKGCKCNSNSSDVADMDCTTKKRKSKNVLKDKSSSRANVMTTNLSHVSKKSKSFSKESVTGRQCDKELGANTSKKMITSRDRSSKIEQNKSSSKEPAENKTNVGKNCKTDKSERSLKSSPNEKPESPDRSRKNDRTENSDRSTKKEETERHNRSKKPQCKCSSTESIESKTMPGKNKNNVEPTRSQRSRNDVSDRSQQYKKPDVRCIDLTELLAEHFASSRNSRSPKRCTRSNANTSKRALRKSSSCSEKTDKIKKHKSHRHKRSQASCSSGPNLLANEIQKSRKNRKCPNNDDATSLTRSRSFMSEVGSVCTTLLEDINKCCQKPCKKSLPSPPIKDRTCKVKRYFNGNDLCCRNSVVSMNKRNTFRNKILQGTCNTKYERSSFSSRRLLSNSSFDSAFGSIDKRNQNVCAEIGNKFVKKCHPLTFDTVSMSSTGSATCVNSKSSKTQCASCSGCSDVIDVSLDCSTSSASKARNCCTCKSLDTLMPCNTITNPKKKTPKHNASKETRSCAAKKCFPNRPARGSYRVARDTNKALRQANRLRNSKICPCISKPPTARPLSRISVDNHTSSRNSSCSLCRSISRTSRSTPSGFLSRTASCTPSDTLSRTSIPSRSPRRHVSPRKKRNKSVKCNKSFLETSNSFMLWLRMLEDIENMKKVMEANGCQKPRCYCGAGSQLSGSSSFTPAASQNLTNTFAPMPTGTYVECPVPAEPTSLPAASSGYPFKPCDKCSPTPTSSPSKQEWRLYTEGDDCNNKSTPNRSTTSNIQLVVDMGGKVTSLEPEPAPNGFKASCKPDAPTIYLFMERQDQIYSTTVDNSSNKITPLDYLYKKQESRRNSCSSSAIGSAGPSRSQTKTRLNCFEKSRESPQLVSLQSKSLSSQQAATENKSLSSKNGNSYKSNPMSTMPVFTVNTLLANKSCNSYKPSGVANMPTRYSYIEDRDRKMYRRSLLDKYNPSKLKAEAEACLQSSIAY